MRKIYHLEFKASGFHFHYGDLTILCNTWGKNLGVSKYTLDRWDFEKPYENENIIIHKTELVTSKRSVK